MVRVVVVVWWRKPIRMGIFCPAKAGRIGNIPERRREQEKEAKDNAEVLDLNFWRHVCA